MGHPRIITALDVIERATTFLGGNAQHQGHAAIRQAMQDALREMTMLRRWTYLLKPDRIRVPAPHTAGSVVYDHTGGSSERLATLTSSTFPSWSTQAAIQFNNDGIWHKVATNPTTTTITLDANLNPGADVASTSTYKMIQCLHTLPADFISLDQPFESDVIKVGRYDIFNAWLARERFGIGSGHPRAFDLIGDPATLGRMALFTLYEPDASEELDYIYYRYPRELYHSGKETRHVQGTISTTASSTTITGTGTAFEDSYEGAVLRISASATSIPTGLDGLRPYKEQFILDTYSSSTSITVKSAAAFSQSGKAYVISDPVDIDPVMITAYFRCVEKHLADALNMRNKAEASELFDQAFQRAAMTDSSRVNAARQPGDGTQNMARPAGELPPESLNQ